jgi:anti-sigma-K factor RsiG
MKGGRRPIDRITDEEYLAGLQARSVDEVREMRGECEKEETLLSYERRLLHGRLDILQAELRRRRGGEEGSLVEQLPQILADSPSQSRGAFPKDVEIPTFENPRRRVEKLVSDDTLARLSTLADDEIEELVSSLSTVEREVSDDRRAVQRVLDEINGELVRRYQADPPDPADVLSRGS